MTGDNREGANRSVSRNAGRRVARDLSTFTALTGDFYRGEIDRATTWRSRLDQTTNWAVIVVTAILTWAFSGEGRPHYVVLIGMFGVTAFLLMEANRYREYDVWRNRVRTLQTHLIAEAFDPGETLDGDWQARLSEDLRKPAFDLSFQGALNHRLRRSYLALLSILALAWLARITVYRPQEAWQQTASILVIPGEAVVAVVGGFLAALLLLTVWSVRGTGTEEFEAERRLR